MKILESTKRWLSTNSGDQYRFNAYARTISGNDLPSISRALKTVIPNKQCPIQVSEIHRRTVGRRQVAHDVSVMHPIITFI